MQPKDHLQELTVTEGEGMPGTPSGFKQTKSVTRTPDEH